MVSWCSRLSHSPNTRKVSGSIPDETIPFSSFRCGFLPLAVASAFGTLRPGLSGPRDISCIFFATKQIIYIVNRKCRPPHALHASKTDLDSQKALYLCDFRHSGAEHSFKPVLLAEHHWPNTAKCCRIGRHTLEPALAALSLPVFEQQHTAQYVEYSHTRSASSLTLLF